MAWNNYNKYGNKKVTIDGMTFDSKKEAQHYLNLKLLEKGGVIKNLQTQVKYVLIPAQYEGTGEYYKKGVHKGEEKKRLVEKECAYYADFVYEQDGKTIVEDTKSKGTQTPQYIIKRKLMRYVYGIAVREV